jgi:hypothetical protein
MRGPYLLDDSQCIGVGPLRLAETLSLLLTLFVAISCCHCSLCSLSLPQRVKPRVNEKKRGARMDDLVK